MLQLIDPGPPANRVNNDDRTGVGEKETLGSMRRAVVTMSVGFGVFLTALAFSSQLLWLRRPFSSLFGAENLAVSIITGAAAGVIAAAMALIVVHRMPGLRGFRRLVRDGFEGIEPRLIDLLLISLVAGWSEELFFRGVLQQQVGIWIASVAFVLVHGVHRVRSRGGIALVTFLYVASVGLGTLYRWFGLESAMAAHAAYDLAVLLGLREMLNHGMWVEARGVERAGSSDHGPPSSRQ